MNKSLLILALAIVTLSSCNKEKEQALTQVINVTLSPNQSYSYTIANASKGDDKMQITLPAAHAAVSTLTANNTNAVFNYTPAQDYVGTDLVQAQTVEEQHSHHGFCGNDLSAGHPDNDNDHHKHHNHDEEATTYLFKITISGTVPK